MKEVTITKEIKVLDHGFVRLIDYMGDDLSIVRSARVSYDAEWRAGEDQGSDARLISYLLKNKHTTPFESVTLTFDVMAPLFVIRQWHRHRMQSYNELSARYRELPELFYVPFEEDIGVQATDNKQMRLFTANEEAEQIAYMIQRHSSAAFKVYHELLSMGTPRELARMVLPLNTYSHMFVTVNLKNLLDFIRLRDHEHAQHEIREYARAMLDLIYLVVPTTAAIYNALREKEGNVK